MSTQPGTYNLTAYRDTKLPFQFTFVDGDEQAVDLSTYTAVKYNFFTLSNQDTPEVSIEATVASNVVSGELTAAQTKSFYNKVVYYQGRFTRADGGDDILMDGRLFVTNVPGSAKEADAVVTVLAESGAVTVVGIISVAEAVAAKVAAEQARDEAAEFKITDAAFVNDDIVFTRSDGQTFSIVGGKTDITPEDAAEVTSAEFVGDDMVFSKSDGTTFTITDAKITLTGPQGEQGPKGDKGDTGEGIGDHRAAGIGDHDDIGFSGLSEDNAIQYFDGSFVNSPFFKITVDSDPFLSYVYESEKDGGEVNDIDSTRKLIRGIDS